MSNKEIVRCSGGRDESREIECAMREVRFPDGDIISGHEYETSEEHDNCHVVVDRCVHCGHVSIGWWHMDNPPKKIFTEEDQS